MANETLVQPSILACCEGCQNHFEVNGKVILSCNLKSEDGEAITLVCYDCPKCSRRHYVQIDNGHTKKLLQELKVHLARAARASKRDNFVSKKQSDKAKKIRERLKKERFALMAKYQGSKLYDPITLKEVEVRFSV